MGNLIDSFWRAAAYCIHPRVIALSLLPLIVCAALALGLAWFFWEPAVAAIRATMESWQLVAVFLEWLDSMGLQALRIVLAPLVLVVLSVPAVVIVALLFVSWLMVPSLVNLVAERRFPALERKRGASIVQSVLWSLVCTVVAVVALIASMPLWLIPPLVLLLPPLIWGWLTYRVMAFDVLSEHASADERRRLLREHRWQLLAMGVLAGYLGAAPSLVWAVSALTLIFAPVLIVVSVWLYTLVLAFSALWFAHYALAALQRMRAEPQPAPVIEVVENSPSMPA